VRGKNREANGFVGSGERRGEAELERGEAWGIEECLVGYRQRATGGRCCVNAMGLIEGNGGQDAAQILAEAFDEPGGEGGRRGLHGRGGAETVGTDCRRHQGYRDNVPCVFHADYASISSHLILASSEGDIPGLSALGRPSLNQGFLQLRLWSDFHIRGVSAEMARWLRWESKGAFPEGRS
jgi:hypothetical protein